MKLIYFDESKQDDSHDWYHLAGVCIDESALQEVEGWMKELAQTAFGSSALIDKTELHAEPLFHGNKNFKGWEFDKRIELLYKIMAILSLPQVQLITVQVSYERNYSGRPVDDVAFMYFVERANDLCKAQGALGVLIGDRQNDKEAARYARILGSYRKYGTDFAWGRKIENLVDSVHFTHSHLSRFLQLADVYCWLEQFRERNRGSENFRHKALFDVWKRDDIDMGPSKYKRWPP